MMNDLVRAHLTGVAQRHDELARAAFVTASPDLAAASQARADGFAAAAERMTQNRRGSLVTDARQAERLAIALAADADTAIGLKFAQAAEDVRAILDGRPARRFSLQQLLVDWGFVAPEPAAAPPSSPPEPKDPSPIASSRRSTRE